jgi:hypothetical protein
MLAVAGASIILLLVVLKVVSALEEARGQHGVFDIELRTLGDAPLWVLLCAGSFIVNGATISRWALISADVGQRRGGNGYEINLPVPILKLASINLIYTGGAVLLFFALRTHVW